MIRPVAASGIAADTGLKGKVTQAYEQLARPDAPMIDLFSS
ncbi:hypothetical protein [Pedobacter sp. Leaf194]|nr:hypothetical protein [Pedobacter sp. Leaf194]